MKHLLKALIDLLDLEQTKVNWFRGTSRPFGLTD
jgi:hypothetical protein